jgi:hypothetical protein
VPNGRITGPLGEIPTPTGKLAQLTRTFHGALLSGAESTLASALIDRNASSVRALPGACG